MTSVPGDLGGKLGSERSRDRDRCPGDLGLQLLSRVLDLRMDYAAYEIDVFGPQAARLAQAQPDERAEQDRGPDVPAAVAASNLMPVGWREDHGAFRWGAKPRKSRSRGADTHPG